MRITIVMGFFLPMPPTAGGAVEKSWARLAREFAARGHEVTLISRRWPGRPDDEIVDNVRYLRLAGFDHRRWLWQNLCCDFIWSRRVYRSLPPADIVVLNPVTLACWLGTRNARTGLPVLMPGRMPKGQFRCYRRPARILVPSAPVREAVTRERPAFGPLVRTVGYPIDWSGLGAASRRDPRSVTIGFVGRLHREKGLHLLATAFKELSERQLPPWRGFFCGPTDIGRGGSGDDYLRELKALVPVQVRFLEPVFTEADLHRIYQEIDLFVYPSLAAQGETFGVAVAEAMAAGAVPVVSDLACFREFVVHGQNGWRFDAVAPGADMRLADLLADCVRDVARGQSLATAAREAVRRYDFGVYAETLLLDFAQLTGGGQTP